MILKPIWKKKKTAEKDKTFLQKKCNEKPFVDHMQQVCIIKLPLGKPLQANSRTDFKNQRDQRKPYYTEKFNIR